MQDPMETNPRGRKIAIAVFGSILAAFCIGAAAMIPSLLGGDGIDHPDEWDPRVAELAEFIEDQRGVAFDYPVHVNFLSPQEYRRAVGSDDSGEDLDIGAESAEGPSYDEAIFRALGLLEGEQDLDESSRALWGEGTAAFFDTVDQQVYVNAEATGAELPIDVKVTVLHELTHAWQTQHSEEDSPDTEWTTDRSDALLAVLEGDATVMEWVFASTLSDAEFDELVDTTTVAADEAQAALTDAGAGDLVPMLFSMPYEFGPSWVAKVLHEHGTTALVAAMGPDVPTTASILGLDVTGGAAVDVTQPELPAGAEELDRDTWGAFSWVVPLAAATDAAAARAAVVDWVGDSVLISESGDTVCIDASLSFADADAATRFELAGAVWASQMPAEAGSRVSRDGSQVSLHSCDPGPEAVVRLHGDAEASLTQLAVDNEDAVGAIIAG